MITDNATVIMKDQPVLLDKVLQDIQNRLKLKLPWLDKAFGRAYKLVEHRSDGNKFIYPAAYVGHSDYVSLVPNDTFTNFSWFDIYDPQEIDGSMPGLPKYIFSGAIIFWYDIRRIYDDDSALYTEEVKDEILKVLTTPGLVSNGGHFDVLKIYERFENIYKGYSLEKIYNNYSYKGEGIESIDKQFFMYPYAGIRIEFKITTRDLCYR